MSSRSKPSPTKATAPAAAGRPSVSVVIATRDRPELLQAAVRSVLGQRYAGPVETVVVFDQQNPRPVGEGAGPDRPVRAISNERTPGPAGAYNTGLLTAGGELVALLNDDDEWLPEKLERQAAVLERHPEALTAVCGIRLADASAGGWRRQPVRMAARELLTLDDLLQTARNEVHTSTLVARREPVLRGVGLIDEAIPGSYGEDYDWLVRAAKRGPIAVVREPLVSVRWSHSYFANRWPMIISALSYQLEHRPELARQPRNLARIYGRLAFAHSAMGDRSEARRWARRSLAIDRTQARPYLAYLVSWGLVRPATLVKAAHAVGRGI